MAVAPLKIVVGIRVGGDSESVGAELSVEYHNFSVAQEGAEIFEFKVGPFKKVNFGTGSTLNSNISAPF